MQIHIFAPKKRVEDGYGNSSDDLLNAFLANGVSATRDLDADADFSLIYGPPEYADSLPEGRRFGIYTMWETEEPPKEWGPYLHTADFVANPTAWGKKVFEDWYGLTNVHHVPLAYKSDVFTYRERPKDREVFTFLSYNSGFGAIRKGFLETMAAFKEAFTPDEPVKLIIKSARPDYYQSGNETLFNLQHRQHDVNGYYDTDSIEYIADACTPEQLAELNYEADCFVFPSRGEGFGHTPLEAMATGLPCLISSGHGMSEYFNPEIHYTFKTKMEKAQFDREGDYGEWPVANIQSLARQMREIYENQDEARERGKQGAEWAKQWSYSKTVKKLNSIIDNL